MTRLCVPIPTVWRKLDLMEAQELTDLIEKLIDKKIERSHLDRENIRMQMMENERDIAETKAKLMVLLQPLFT